jgi:type II secretory pathway pseudopilin PulG
MSRRIHLAAEHGYSMLAVVLVMLVTGLLTATAFAAVAGDIPFARDSQDRKQAYAAAEAGIEYYLYQLARDNDYWTNCADVDDGEPINVENPPAETRKWRTVAGADARYSIELLPSEGACDPDRPEETMLNEASGTFRIRATGESRGERRTIVSTYRRSSFLDYLYFTDYEASDPLVFSDSDDVERARDDCVEYRAVRELDAWCKENVSITFPDWDAINGPLHTNDDLLTCGVPEFGRVDRTDRIEISGPAENGWTRGSGNNCGAGPPKFNGIVRHPAPTLTVPESNTRLRDHTLDVNRFKGQTKITFDGTSTMKVQRMDAQKRWGPVTNMALPENGVIYVEKDGACGIDAPRAAGYNDERGCAILTVSGTYPKSMTLGSEDDIVIEEDLKRANDNVVLGLIANRFVRVRHQQRSGTCGGNIDNNPLHDIEIQAAILALNDSFIVDNYQCGSPMGTLTVYGAIAQKFRGPVGTFNGNSKSSGYTKSYNYDDRLRYRSPPYFLDPVSAAWRVVRSNEQAPGSD